MLRATFAAVLVALLLPAAAWGQPPGLEVVEPDELALTFDGTDSSSASVWVKNTTTAEVVPVFRASVEDSDGDAVRLEIVVVDDDDRSIDARPLQPGVIGRYRLSAKPPPRTSPADASGELVVSGGGAAGSVSLSIGKKPFADRGVTETLLWPILPALLLIALAGWLATRGSTSLGSPLPPDLDFKTSFASTAAAAGALLATVISASVLPETTTILSKEAFVALNLIFGIGVVVAGLVYAALQRPVWVDLERKVNPVTKEPEPERQQRKMQGTVGTFLVASLVTVWAVFGELLTIWLLLDELGQGQGFSEGSLIVFKLLIVAAALTMAVYTWRRIPAIVASERPKPKVEKAKQVVTEDETRIAAPTGAPMKSVSML